MTEIEIQKRLDAILVQWMKASREERSSLLIERLGLERKLHELRVRLAQETA